jgi:hypothetical protein
MRIASDVFSGSATTQLPPSMTKQQERRLEMRGNQSPTQSEENVVGLFNPRGSRARPHCEMPPCENCGAALIPHHPDRIKGENTLRICIVCGHQNRGV